MELKDLFKERLTLLQSYSEYALAHPNIKQDPKVMEELLQHILNIIIRIKSAIDNQNKINQTQTQIENRKKKINKFMSCIYKHSYIPTHSFLPTQLTLEEIVKTSSNLSCGIPPLYLGKEFLPKYVYYQPEDGFIDCSISYPFDPKKRMPKPKIAPYSDGLPYTYVKPGQIIAIDARDISSDVKSRCFVRYTLDESIPTSTVGIRYELQTQTQAPIAIQKDEIFSCVLCCMGYMDSKVVQVKFKVTAEGQAIESSMKNANMLIVTQHSLGELDILPNDLSLPGMTPLRMTPSASMTPSSKTPLYSSIYTPVYDKNRKNSSGSNLESP